MIGNQSLYAGGTATAIEGDRVAGTDSHISPASGAQGATLYLASMSEGHCLGFHTHTPRVACRSGRTNSPNNGILTREPRAPVHHEGGGGHRHIPTPTNAMGDTRDKRALMQGEGLRPD